MTKRHVSLPADAEDGLGAFIEEVDRRLSGEEDTCAVVEDVLVDLHGDRRAYERWQAGEDVSAAERVRLQGYDPCNATIESEYYAEKDEAAFERSKHLQWLWRQFDATPMADNVEFALRFRRMLAEHLFAECGEGCRFFKSITFTYGHNISVGDNVVIHDDVHLDDRGTLTIGDRVSVSDGVHVYSHDHDIVDQTAVDNYHTILEDDVRVTFDAMVRAGCRVGENAIVGARSVVQSDVPAHHVVVGQPAQSVRIKPGWEDVADPISGDHPDGRGGRQLEYDLPENLEQFDEFGRELNPPADR
ncbi:O-acetyltransferase (homolog to galactoside O-acetyltransferase) [Natronomonas moolapensis 8.8.11]|uniref:O-acetyltransferase (Homolog to galactoside O-acetyltransferase) n=1 Tax=Natronomonas moolapensis (strain DSM 18674 / CECT 7526 / JCM 14361 / 8.8.11) TaxID=268739 RepID=M1XPG6_NATM8|nr:acyltransferase [Natronomonas moolapensis]CCQ35871.1 O-acetyltransferase (homolog to galactoside O-acetyltransferase) [Natronomonas moolapensis 8.8.11]